MCHINRLWNGLLLRLWLPTSPSQNWNKQLRLLWSQRLMWGQRTGSVQILHKTLCEYLNDWVTGSSLIKSFIFTIMHAILMCSSFFKGDSFLRTGKSLALQLHKCQVERKSNKAGLTSRKTWSKSRRYLKSYVWVLRSQSKTALVFAYIRPSLWNEANLFILLTF